MSAAATWQYGPTATPPLRRRARCRWRCRERACRARGGPRAAARGRSTASSPRRWRRIRRQRCRGTGVRPGGVVLLQRDVPAVLRDRVAPWSRASVNRRRATVLWRENGSSGRSRGDVMGIRAVADPYPLLPNGQSGHGPSPSFGPRVRADHPLTDRNFVALLGAADADLLAAISILALSGMRLDELRRLRVAQCGRGAFRVGECAANHGPPRGADPQRPGGDRAPLDQGTRGGRLPDRRRRRVRAGALGDGAAVRRVPPGNDGRGRAVARHPRPAAVVRGRGLGVRAAARGGRRCGRACPPPRRHPAQAHLGPAVRLRRGRPPAPSDPLAGVGNRHGRSALLRGFGRTAAGSSTVAAGPRQGRPE